MFTTYPVLLPLLALLGSLISLCVGSSYAKTLFPVLGAQGTTLLRLLFATLLLLIYWRPWRIPLARREAVLIITYGIVLGAMNLFFYLSIARIPLGVAVAIEFMGPLALAIASSRKALDFLWIGFAILGLGLLLPLHQHAGPLDLSGVGFALAAAVCWALYIITGQRAGKAHVGQATALGMLTATLVVTPFGLGAALPAFQQPNLLLAALAIGLLSSAIPYSLEMFALKHIPKQTFSILLSLEPAVGALAALFILNEMLTPLQWLAIGSIIVASAGSTLGVKPIRQATQTEVNPL